MAFDNDRPFSFGRRNCITISGWRKAKVGVSKPHSSLLVGYRTKARISLSLWLGELTDH